MFFSDIIKVNEKENINNYYCLNKLDTHWVPNICVLYHVKGN